MSFRRRNFPEVLDNILTSLIGGVGAEPHPFPPEGAKKPPFQFILQQGALDVVSVYGSRNGQPYLFRKESDYRLKDEQTLEWLEKGELADEGSLIFVNYTRKAAQPVLTDIHTGSVVRTLAESISLEIARLYAELQAVYDSAFIDTASGKALDNVVALLGIERIQGGRATGTLEFSRAQGSHGSITIPAGTRVITEDGEIEYETTEAVTMLDSQNSIRVTARDLERNDPLPVGALKVIPVPIAGVAGVTNPAPTVISTQDQTDEQLRTQAKSFLHGSERATLGALRQAIARQGIQAEITEGSDTLGPVVVIKPHADLIGEPKQRLLAVIEAVRPAGVRVSLGSPVLPRKLRLSLQLTTSSDLPLQQLRAAHTTVKEKVIDYFTRLASDQDASLTRLVGLVMGVPEIQDVALKEAAWQDNGEIVEQKDNLLKTAGIPVEIGEVILVDPNLPTRLNVVVTYTGAKEAPVKSDIQAALNASLMHLNADSASRALSYGLLLLTTPLPDKPATLLADYDAATTKPGLPDENDISGYSVQYSFSQQSGLTKLLSVAADSYNLAAQERLVLEEVTVIEV